MRTRTVLPACPGWVMTLLAVIAATSSACSVDPLTPPVEDRGIDRNGAATDSRFTRNDRGENQSDGPMNCTPESDAAFCQRYGKNCNLFVNLDNCGASRTVNCGECTVDGDSCGGSGVENVCGQANCTRESDAAFCARYGKDCDEFTNSELLRRVFAVDVLICRRCLGPMTVLAALSEPPVLAKILTHLGLPSTSPALAPAQRRGQLDLFDELGDGGADESTEPWGDPPHEVRTGPSRDPPTDEMDFELDERRDTGAWRA